eukprot:CAMPEP_0168351946 /NCGR_PEP_ID=MMETSP0213-20121227/22227_1 /TAXON_ID=151035 /ORGANISM="Euplotes harpa, Strain FSP1.4" /LENGTH=74 /DNA_ID=CAMNT_0008363001 /DNA_START=336 /DNA_END=557 /DNA_ORIENTATION=-
MFFLLFLIALKSPSLVHADEADVGELDLALKADPLRLRVLRQLQPALSALVADGGAAPPAAVLLREDGELLAAE